MVSLVYRDAKYLFEVVITVWMLVTSVAFPADRAEGMLRTLLMLNPMTPVIDAYRAVLVQGELPGLPFIRSALVSCGCLAVARLTFHRSEFEFAENI